MADRKIIQLLNKNRSILRSLLSDQAEMVRIGREALLKEGYQFGYLTHERRNARGAIIRYCFGYGYLELDKDWLLLVREKVEQEI